MILIRISLINLLVKMLNISPDNYTSAAIYRNDVKKIFTGSWQLVCPVSRLAKRGDYYATEISGLKVFVIKTQNGLRAFRNVCRHIGARLLPEGCGTSGTIRCPYHQWVWGEGGELINVPWWGKDPDFESTDWKLDEISVKVWRGLLFLAVKPELNFDLEYADLLEEIKDDPIETFIWTHEEKLVFNANWKIYTDNFVEGYHIPGVHPAFHKAIDFDKFETIALNGHVRMTAPPRNNLFYKGKWLWMWPNWTLSFFDGGMNTSRINPIDTNKTELIYNFYFEDISEHTKEKRDKIITDNLNVIREDFEVCIETHKNYDSGAYRPGPLSPRHEQGVAYFQDRLIASSSK